MHMKLQQTCLFTSFPFKASMRSVRRERAEKYCVQKYFQCVLGDLGGRGGELKQIVFHRKANWILNCTFLAKYFKSNFPPHKFCSLLLGRKCNLCSRTAINELKFCCTRLSSAVYILDFDVFHEYLSDFDFISFFHLVAGVPHSPVWPFTAHSRAGRAFKFRIYSD